MYFEDRIWIGTADGERIGILPKMANRHGLIAGATGTGKTMTLKVLAESFSDAGVPVFLADMKGDLSGICRQGLDSGDMQERIKRFGLEECGFRYQAYPTEYWDVYGKAGIPLRTTISEMGPVLLSRLMELTATQADILTIIFKIADDNELLLIDTKDLKAMLQYVADHNKEFSTEYGNMAKQSLAAILRHVVALESQGGEFFFGEPALNIRDWFATDREGRGTIHVLDGRELANNGLLYSAFLLWMMSELYEELPEVGDMEKPRMVFFFDEAHLLFDGISKALEDKIEQIVKLIRSKGVGIYFVTQNPRDIPDEVLAQLGNKIQHALRAYTPGEEKAVKVVANSFRPNPAFQTGEALKALGIGEALVSVLDEEGVPGIVQRCNILPPQSQAGPLSEGDRELEVKRSNLYLKYASMEDRDSAYEFLARVRRQEETDLAAKKQAEEEAKLAEKQEKLAQKEAERQEKLAQREAEKRAREAQREAERQAKEAEREAEKKKKAVAKGVKSVATTAAGTVGREVGNNIGKQVGGTFGKRLGGNIGASLGRSILGTFLKF